MRELSSAGSGPAPSVSVVMPAYNASRTIEDSIFSVLGQSLRDIELIVVDDGSSDGTPDLVRELAAMDQRVRLVAQQNAGPSAARNRGVLLSRAGIVAFLDSDDVWSSDHLERHVQALAEDAQLGVSFSPCEFMSSAGDLTGERSRCHAGDVTAADLLGSNPTTTCSALVVRKSVFERAGGMSDAMKYAEDQEWLFRVVCSGWRVRSIESRTVRYRTSPNGLSANSASMLAGWHAFVETARKISPEVVDRHLSAATAHIHMYHARRAIRTGQPGRTARMHFLRAFLASPRTVVSNLRGSLVLAAACAAPVLANRVVLAAKGPVHA
jgi:glycosyltransferase involved in cell wall biosynthesis